MRHGHEGGRSHNDRHQIECRLGLLQQARGGAVQYDEFAVRYGATVQVTLARQLV
ncbi:hypothetical protein [Streptomyces macrosporus]|uniref:hypothetical protein n=1 Tax=Streptomyces macrosporus TaxID=44032 RepID=UPI0031E0C017